MDLLLTNATVAHAGAIRPGVDIAIEGGRIVAVEPGIAAQAKDTIDCGGRLVSAALVESHIHLEIALTAGVPRGNLSGTLLEGIAIWSEYQPRLSRADVLRRARQVIDWQVAQGVGFVRSHVDVSDPNLVAAQAMLELRDEVRDRIDLQLVAFPQLGLVSHPQGASLLRRALDMGCDAVGAIPHFEASRESGIESLKIVFDEAARRGLAIDVHCDETDDSGSRFTEIMAEETIRRGLGGRVTASHCTAMHSYDNAYAGKLIGWLAQAGVNIVANPLDNLLLQARQDSYPKRRGITRVKELLQAGINVSLGNDSVVDPFCPMGRADPVEAAQLTLFACQMSGAQEIDSCFDMITWRGGRTLGLADYGVAPGCRADLAVFDAASPSETMRRNPAALHVFRAGRKVAETAPARSTVLGRPVDPCPAGS